MVQVCIPAFCMLHHILYFFLIRLRFLLPLFTFLWFRFSIHLTVVDTSCYRFITGQLFFSARRIISSSLLLPLPVQLVVRPNSILFYIKINPFKTELKNVKTYSSFWDQMSFFRDKQIQCELNSFHIDYIVQIMYMYMYMYKGAIWEIQKWFF